MLVRWARGGGGGRCRANRIIIGPDTKNTGVGTVVPKVERKGFELIKLVLACKNEFVPVLSV